MTTPRPPVRAAKRELFHTWMYKLKVGDWLVRDDAIGTVEVTDLVKLPKSRLVVHYRKPDRSTGEYLTWMQTHARILAVPSVDTSTGDEAN